MRLRPCAACSLEASCVYPTVFETAPDPAATKMRRYARVPHPYVLQPPPHPAGRLAKGEVVTLDVTLVGRSARHIAYVVRALQEAGAGGLGPDRLPLELTDVAVLPPDRPPFGIDEAALQPGLAAEPTVPAIPPCPNAIEIELASPLRLLRDGHLVGPDAFTPADLLGSLVRRVSMLGHFFTEHGFETDFRALKDGAAGLAWRQRDVQWLDLVRRSSRQDTLMRMGGIVGRVRLDLAGAEAFWPFLWLGQWIGGGKGATMGLGQLRLHLA